MVEVCLLFVTDQSVLKSPQCRKACGAVEDKILVTDDKDLRSASLLRARTTCDSFEVSLGAGTDVWVDCPQIEDA